MYPQKGAMLVGADADIVISDPESTKKIWAPRTRSVIGYNVFEGKEVTGLPRFVLSRGRAADPGRRDQGQAGPRASSSAARPIAPLNRALSKWKQVVAPRKVERSGIPAGV